jgi:hypothetical protein
MGIAYLTMSAGLCGWPFFHSLVAWRTGRITVPTDDGPDDIEYVGWAAKTWAVLGMAMGLGLYCASWIPVVSLLR